MSVRGMESGLEQSTLAIAWDFRCFGFRAMSPLPGASCSWQDGGAELSKLQEQENCAMCFVCK